MQPIAAKDKIIFLLYVIALGSSCVHLYLKPIYAMDEVQYMGNALLMEDRDIVSVHHRVYDDLRQRVPAEILRGLLGNDPSAQDDQNKSRQERARNPEALAQFLPVFAIRPLYNQSLWLLSKSGLGLVRSATLISVASYFIIGIFLIDWIRQYTGAAFGSTVAFLLMMSPPLTDMGRDLTSDAAATMLAFASLYFIFEKQWLTLGLIVLLTALFFRTDFVVLAGPVLFVCWLEGRIDLWKAGVLSLLAVGSVLMINHFAGDYGIKMLYYRNFVGTPIAPAEMTIHFSFHDYLAAFRSGLTLALNSYLIPFLLLGFLGLGAIRLRPLFGVALAYIGLHFIILPNWQERWFGVFYLCCGICAVVALKNARIASPPQSEVTLPPDSRSISATL
ncbi:MAG TPA: hypothetical protein VFO46_07190 [Candidatus Sulfotelmatobacter sp.]|nr:hypothetical protein [Candidatus Sulfotelmatobacter sp.]